MRLRCESWTALGILLLLAGTAPAQTSVGDALSKYLDAATETLASGGTGSLQSPGLDAGPSLTPTATDVSHLLTPPEPGDATPVQPISHRTHQSSYWDESHTGQSTQIDFSSSRFQGAHTQVYSGGCATGNCGGCATGDCGAPACSSCQSCDTGCGECIDYCGCKPFCWYAGVEAMNWRRSKPRDGVLVINDATGAALLTNDDLDMDGEEGFRIQLGYWVVPGRVALEANYFGIHDWESRPATADMGNLNVPFQTPPMNFMNFDVAVIDYRSELDSAEFNVRCRGRRQSNLSLLTGFRYIRVKEEMQLRSLMMDGTQTGQYYLLTENELVLMQGGLEWDGQIIGKLGLDIRAVAGGGVNLAYQSQQIAGLRNNFSHDTDGIYFGDATASVTYRLARSVRIRAGYNLLYLGGMALAPEQVNFSDLANTQNSDVNTNGSLFYHGVSFGLDFFR